MPLRCITTAGDSLLSLDYDTVAWDRLRDENARTGHLLTTCCSTPVVLKRSRRGLHFFAHKHQGECATAVESRQHLELKALAVSVIRACGWSVETEVAGTTPDGEPWVADVLASRGNAKVAVEIQWSPQTDDETAARQARYERSGVRGLWLFHQANFPVERGVPAACVEEDAAGGYVAMLGAEPSLARRSRARPEDWQQSMPAGELIRAAFEGRFWFGLLQPGTYATVKCVGGFVKCWKCQEWTNVLYNLELCSAEQGAESADFGVSEIPEDLLPELIPNPLRAWKVGQIKKRFSHTEGASYVSNGCVECDALQGRFFMTEIMHRLKPITEYPVKVSKRLAAAVDDQYGARWHVSHS